MYLSAECRMVYEVVEPMVDNFVLGYCSTIRVTLKADRFICIEVDGTGFDLGERSYGGIMVPRVYASLTDFRTVGGVQEIFWPNEELVHSAHSAGIRCVNALSACFSAESHCGGACHTIRFAQGRLTQPLRSEGKTTRQGTVITFLPDPEIFPDHSVFDSEELARNLKHFAIMGPGLNILFSNEYTGQPEQVFFAPEN
ncbi:MAG: hypothetical protein ACAI35_27990 [Candidatus Methylacidiphilales bacterium]|nr:hypothetical protein [Candidatus Methylacidiphilales bacterium]